MAAARPAALRRAGSRRARALRWRRMAADEDKHAAQRPLTSDDLQRREELGDVALSPDGRRLAFVLKRARCTRGANRYAFLDGDDRGDLWLVETSGGTPHNLTHGELEDAGYWAPCWSPASDRIAL